MARAKSGGSGGAVCLALRIATVALSAASAATMASATQQPTTTAAAARRAPAATASISYSDYSSFRYSLAANVISAALQLAAAWLAARGGGGSGEGYGKAAKSLAELVDMASKVLLYSSSAVSFAVNDFGTCGRRVAGVCTDAVEFCRRVHGSGALSMAAAVALAVSQYLKDVPVSISFDGDEQKPATACRRGCHCRHH
ncbi:hypothetical protein ACP70R_007778 [Stipagrostis hirtigluma subsp. patula]